LKAYIVSETGGPDVLRLQDVPDPIAGEGEVLIKVRAFGINRVEVDRRSGVYGPITHPTVLGIEAVGEVIQDPSGLYRPGHRVATAMGGLGYDRAGSYAQQLVARRENIVSLESASLPWNELAALPEAFLTAWGTLTPALRISSGHCLLVRGAATSVGRATIILGKQLGASVIATTRRESQREPLLALGAGHVLIDEGEIAGPVRAIWPHGADAAVELVGASTLRDTMRTVRPYGEVATIGVLGGRFLGRFDLLTDLPDAVSLRFFPSSLLGTPALPLDNAPLEHVAIQQAAGHAPSILGHTFTFEQVPEAHALIETNQTLGKIVIIHKDN